MEEDQAQGEDPAADPQIEEEEEQEEAPFEMREEDERKEVGEKKIEEETVKQIASAKEYIKNSLDSISLTELKRLADDDDYSDDTLMTSNAFLTMCKKKDNVEDETLRLANENIKLAEQLEQDS